MEQPVLSNLIPNKIGDHRLLLDDPQYQSAVDFLYEQAISHRNKPLYFESKDLTIKYHPSIWYCSCDNAKSPYEALHDDKLLLEAIHNQLKYRADDLSFFMTIKRFTISKIAKRITLFKPALMRKIIDKVKPKYIIDPFSGFSGRLIGARQSGIPYKGFDINPVTVAESNNLIKSEKFFACEISEKDVLKTFDETNYDSLITCSPYNLKERWQLPIENKSCDEWIEAVFKAYPNCKQYIFVVDKTEKYQDRILFSKDDSSHLTSNEQLILRFGTN